MSQTSGDQSSPPMLIFNNEFWDKIRPIIRENFVEVALLFALYGTEISNLRLRLD